MSSRWVLTLAGALAIAPSATAQAQPSDTTQLDAARALANAGLDLFQAGRHQEALERFEGAERIHHAPPHVLYIARSLAALGRLVEARDAYATLAVETIEPDAPPVFASAKKDAVAELDAIQPRIAHLTIVVAGEGASLQLDDRPVAPGEPIDVDPGEHRVTATKPGVADREQVVTVAEGESASVTVEIPDVATADDAETASGSSLVGPIVLIGLGGAGLILGGVMGGLALGKRNALDDACPDPAACPADNRALEDDGRTFGNVSTAGFVVGGVAAAAGVTWLLLAMPDNDEVAIRPYASPMGFGIEGRF